MPTVRKRKTQERRRPGEVRDAIVPALSTKPYGASVTEIQDAVRDLIGSTPPSSIRSYLRLNSDSLFRRPDRGVYTIHEAPAAAYGSKPGKQILHRSIAFGRATLFEADCFEWLRHRQANSLQWS